MFNHLTLGQYVLIFSGLTRFLLFGACFARAVQFRQGFSSLAFACMTSTALVFTFRNAGLLPPTSNWVHAAQLLATPAAGLLAAALFRSTTYRVCPDRWSW